MVATGQPVVLRGGARLPPEDERVCVSEKDTLQYHWEQISGPLVAVRHADQIKASFVPSLASEYMFRFRAIYPVTEVNSKPKTSDWAYTKVIVRQVECDLPVADAGTDQVHAAIQGAPLNVRLDGSGSHTTIRGGCEGLALSGFSWRIVRQPAGANAEIQGGDRAMATADLEVVGEYEFELSVRDNGGTAGRTDTDADTVLVTLVPSPVCEEALNVVVVNAWDGQPMENVHVTVVDAAGVSHAADTGAGGVAAFDGLAAGRRRSITVVSDERVPALPGAEDADRPRFETTTVLDHCAEEIVIRLRYTASGEAALPTGIVTAKVPESLFNLLPHSWKCTGSCETDNDCDEDYYCELQGRSCQNLCTPRSLLPVFSLGDHNVSGQFRAILLTQVYQTNDRSQFPEARIFSPPPVPGAVKIGNFVVDDTFVNGLAPSFGLDPWGEPCERTPDCPNPYDYVCEQDPQGDYRCKDKNPMRNIWMELPAGERIAASLILGIVNVDMQRVLSIMLPASPEGEMKFFDFAEVLGGLHLQTLLVCPLVLDVPGNAETDISNILADITAEDCWSVEYVQKDSVVALKDPHEESVDSCETDSDCCDWNSCGWPDSGRKCLEDPDSPGDTGCFMPLFRVEIITGDEMTFMSSVAGFDPAAAQSDDRLCSWVPDRAPYEVLCDTGTPGIYEPCDPRRVYDLDVPDDAECSFPYSLTVASLDVQPGHVAFPDGGRVVLGWEVNRSPSTLTRDPSFFIPSLRKNQLEGGVLRAVQFHLRRVIQTPSGKNRRMTGRLAAVASTRSNVVSHEMPALLNVAVPDGVVDAGFIVGVAFIPEDPSVWPPVLERAYSVVRTMMDPEEGVHDLPETVSVPVLPESDMVGLIVSRVDRGDDWNTLFLVDPWWRIYAPMGTSVFDIPSSLSPFSPGDHVWLSPVQCTLEASYDYDLFPTGQIPGHRVSCSEDGYALISVEY